MSRPRPEPVQVIKTRRDAALERLVGGVPYIAFLGIRFERHGDELTAVLPYADRLIGNPMLPALHGGATVRTVSGRPGVFAVWGYSTSFFRYTVDTWVTIHHLPTGHIETFHRRWQPRSADLPGYRIDNLHASGPIRLRIRSVTHGPVHLPPVTCSGSAVV